MSISHNNSNRDGTQSFCVKSFTEKYEANLPRVHEYIQNKVSWNAWRAPREMGEPEKGQPSRLELTDDETSRIGADVESIPLEWRDVRPWEAEAFLRLLDPDHESFCFYTIDNVIEDGHKREHEDLTRSFDNDELRTIWRDLAKLNDQGAGVYVTVQRMNGKGRTKQHVDQVRALFVDLDDSPLEVVRDCPLQPHMIVETSPGRYHACWLVRGLHADAYEGVARGAAEKFSSDPAVAMLTTGARLPGFYHTKGEPFRVRLIETNDVAPYTDEQIIEAFPPIDKVTRPPSSIGIILTSRSPVEAAKLFASKFTREGEALPALVHHRGDIYKWNGRHYTPFGEYNLTEELYEFLSQIWIAKTNQQGVTQHEPFNPSRSKVGEVRDALAAGVNQDEHCHPPFYYGKGPSGINLVVDGSQEIAARNGLLNLTTRKFEPHSQFFFTTSSLPFAYDKNAPKPVEWYRFLRQLWPTNKVARRCLQEIFGLALTTDTSFQKLFLIVGPKRSGKGTIGRVLREMLSSAAVAAPTLKSLSGDFGLQSLINKRMAIISDARLGSGDASVTSR